MKTPYEIWCEGTPKVSNKEPHQVSWITTPASSEWADKFLRSMGLIDETEHQSFAE